MPVYSNLDVLGTDFLHLMNSPKGADVRLIVGEEQVVIHAHSLILQARSTYFARALNNDWKEANQGVIHKPNISPAVFERILQYIYGGRLLLDDDTVMDLIKAADEMCMEDLLHGCERHALTTIRKENVLELAHLASQHNLMQLKAECLDFIACNFDHLKRGKTILTLDADTLKDILSMDQLDIDELELWKIAVRWAYYQQGLNWANCPLLDFPKVPGRVVVQIQIAEESSPCRGPFDIDTMDESEDLMADSRVPLSRGTSGGSSSGLQEMEEDGFRPPANSVFQQTASNTVVQLSPTVHEELCRHMTLLLPAIRFMRIPSMDFLRLIEGTGLVPMQLCAKVYRYHSVPSMADPYQTSLRRRMAFSTILNKDQKEVVMEWLQSAMQDPPSTSSPLVGSTSSSWHRRSHQFSLPTSQSHPLAVLNGTQQPSSATAAAGASSPPSLTSPLLHSSRAMTASSPLGHRPTRSGSSVSFQQGSSSSSSPLSAASTYLQQQQQQQQPAAYQGQGQAQQQQQQQQQTYYQPTLQNQPKLTLQYRATRDGFDAANFHMACDQRGPTLTVVRADNGAVFGGYNSSSWSSHPSGVYSTSRVNFLFTLKSREHPTRENAVFGIKGDGNAAAYNKADYGPTFGVGHDLYLASNCNLTGQSSSTMPSSYNGPGASAAALAGSFYFRVQEYEVFLVQPGASAAAGRS
ncbi:hypothetical protein BGZ70_009291 [Mortierella alpina]|uniref:BTB domain-containing protein n=1 Tax=Mortierella alpina TaxID=64518 RepID=A0A9P6M0I4_MORAP|nr:hypothetical protein BGZ70_009291 [Mortierella alpina]